MDLVSTTLILTSILSILALLISILGFLDNRKKTKILEKQLSLLQQQSESRQDTRNALKIVTEIQGEIARLGVEKYDWGDFGRTAPLRFLEMLHDSGEQSIVWKVHLITLFGKTIGKGTGTVRMLEDIRNFEAFETLFAEMVPEPETTFIASYISTPQIMLNPDIEIDSLQVKDFVTEIYSLAIMYQKLNSAEKIVNMYDSSILLDIKKLYTKVLRSLYEKRFGEIQEIEINSKIKTKDMKNYLLRFVSLDTWQECIKELKENIKPRLIDVMRHLQESA
jgi:hypothetical protein